jgi:DNA-binding FrmR family transcriptional regulator
MPATKRPEPAPPRTVHRTDKAALLKRLHRIEGQVRGLGKMVEEDRYCVDVLTQISAVRSALDAVALGLLRDHTRGCVRNAIRHGQGDEAIDELVEVLSTFSR